MAVKNGKLERLITIPATATVNLTDDGGGPTLITITAGTYYHSTAGSTANDLAAQFAADATAGMTATWTCTIAAGEAGTGKVSIGNDDTVCTVSWTNDGVSLKETLGFETDGNLSGNSGATGYTSTDQARGIFLPNVPKLSPYGDGDDGWHETDGRWTESASGHAKGLYSTRKQVLALAWEHLRLAKTRIVGESTTNESFEKFWEDAILGIPSWSVGPMGPIRYYPDAAVDGTSSAYKVMGELLTSFRPEQLVENSTQLWRIILDRMVLVPS